MGGYAEKQADGSVMVPTERNTFADTLSRIVLVKNDQLSNIFTASLKINERNRSSGAASSIHNPTNPDPAFEQEKEAVRSVLKSKFRYMDLLGFKKSNVVLTFHGCSHESAHGICSSGMTVAVGAAEKGNGVFFGSGHYTTSSAGYACMYALSTEEGGLSEEPRPANPKGERVVVAQFGSVERAYAGLSPQGLSAVRRRHRQVQRGSKLIPGRVQRWRGQQGDRDWGPWRQLCAHLAS